MSPDVLVVGSGPAGASVAAALAGHGADVWLVDRRRTSSPARGEILPGQVMAQLAGLGIQLDLREVGTPCTGSVSRWEAERAGFEDFALGLPGPRWSVDRAQLDARLIHAAEQAGATLLRAPARVVPGVSGRALQVAGHVLSPRWVIDATGRARVVARGRGAAAASFDRQVAVIGVLCPSAPGLSPRLWIEARDDGWLYRAPLPCGRIVVALFSDADRIHTHGWATPGRWWAELSPWMRQQLRTPPPQLHTAPASATVLEPSCGPGWIAVGDAASTLDPLSSGGVSKALRSAADAVAVIQGTMPLATYAERRSDEVELHWSQQRAQHASARRGGGPFWARRRHPVALAPDDVLSLSGRVADPLPLSPSERTVLSHTLRSATPAHVLMQRLRPPRGAQGDRRRLAGLTALGARGVLSVRRSS